MVDSRMLPEALRGKAIMAVAEHWENVLYLVQDGDDLQWRVYGCFGTEGHVLGGPFPSAEAALPSYLAHMVWIRDCARHFYERGRLSAVPVPPAPGERPVLTLV